MRFAAFCQHQINNVMMMMMMMGVPLWLFVGVATSPLVSVEQRPAVRRVVWVCVIRSRLHRRQRDLFRVEDRLAQTVAVSRRPSQTLGPSRFPRQHGSLLFQRCGYSCTAATFHQPLTYLSRWPTEATSTSCTVLDRSSVNFGRHWTFNCTYEIDCRRLRHAIHAVAGVDSSSASNKCRSQRLTAEFLCDLWLL